MQCVALFLRCQTERQRRRTVERAMMQLQELTQAYSMEKVRSLAIYMYMYMYMFCHAWSVMGLNPSSVTALGVLCWFALFCLYVTLLACFFSFFLLHLSLTCTAN